MKRGTPVFVQAIALVVATAATAQLITIGVLLALPAPRDVFVFGDVAEAVQTAAPVEREGQVLSVRRVDTAPRGWQTDSRLEAWVRVTLAHVLEVPLEDVLVKYESPVPGWGWLMRMLNEPTDAPARPVEPSRRGAATVFKFFSAAVRTDDGSWVIVRLPSRWPGVGPGTFLLIWLALNALVLVPLAWLFTRRLVAPIRAFAEAAERAGRGDKGAVFPEVGPREVRTSARALAEMQRRIAGAVEERTRLIAAIAHDLRTPLTRLRFRAEYAPADQRQRMVQDIEHMDAMIGGVLAFARGEQGHDRQRVDLRALVQSLADDLVDTGADVTVVDAVPVEVVGDLLALRRLVGNLLDNAIKYGGRARCHVLRRDEFALLHIDDDGPGIAEDALERMFTPFERGDAARDPSTGGVGLGLALARAIAQAHGGSVWLSRLTVGLRAHVRLPAAPGGADRDAAC